jgi:serine/threonine protein kinase
MSSPRRKPASDEVWAEMRSRQRAGQALRAEDWLKDVDPSHQDRDFVLDVIHAELFLREQAGERPRLEEFVARFPHLRDELTRQFEVHWSRSGTASLSGDAEPETTDATPPTGEWQTTTSVTPLPTPARTAAPQTIGKYRVIEELGSGGQATVYRAVHPTLGQDVVIKISRHPIETQGEEVGHRLAEEGRILATLKSRNIARIYDFDVEAGRPYVVMEYVQGRSLQQVAQQALPSPGQAAAWVAQLARGVAEAHAHGVVHLDLKPANVLMGADGVPRLIDFGLGRLRQAWHEPAERSNETSGTLPYMAPERLGGDGDAPLERADVFGLGAVLYFLLTGRPPFQGKSASDVWEKVATGRWDRERLAAAPPELRRICEKCLAKDPQSRFATADELAHDLERFARPSPTLRRALIGIAGLLVLGAVWFGVDRRRRDRPDVPLVPLEASLQVRVWNEGKGRFQDLARSLPLQTRDEIKVEGDRPRDCFATLLWVDSEGKVVQRVEQSASDPETAIGYPPAPSRGTRFEGAGTELFVLCGRRDRPVDLARLSPLLDRFKGVPALPSSAFLKLSREKVSVEDLSRGPGPLVEGDDPERVVKKRLEELGRALRDECEFVEAIAVSHR